ncbi:cyclin-T2-like isoform X2 [Xyrauchen texanus]|uniref:cyclin-T2-like isoform X2 n=1 Tax=Xyrauchen texanus TaxID=154827 RepID=UPI002242B247|nr:cyclin-T2-like isoform X2 [Xyrauchen texanus]
MVFHTGAARNHPVPPQRNGARQRTVVPTASRKSHSGNGPETKCVSFRRADQEQAHLTISPTTLFLAAKVEEQPRKLEHVIKVTHACLNPQESPLDTKSNAYLQQAQELVILETIVLQTLGFEITIEHPHTDVVKCSQLVRASKDLAQTSYFMATNSLHLTTFCLQYKPTVIACVCIHLACKWSNWEIPVSTDGKHWWEYVDSSVTLELLDELTHEFLQILEKTPSRLKRIRNWRATQAAKKPKTDGQASNSSSLPGPSLTQDLSLMDALPGDSTNTAFSKASTSFPVTLTGNPSSSFSLDSIGNMQESLYTYTAPSDWPQDQASSDSYSVKQLLPNPSMHAHRPDKGAEFNPTKHTNKASGGAKHQVMTCPPPAAPAQKMSLDKYREKHAAELAVQKRRQEQQNVETEVRDVYGAPAQTDHRKHLPQLSHGQQGLSSCAGASTASPLKMKLPVPGQDKQVDKREKGSSLKLRLPVPSQSEKGGSSKEELKMKIKVSSERHSSSDEGAAKGKHSSPLVSKEKHRDHSAHRHHHKHGHSHSHTHSGNGRSGLEAPAAGLALRSPVGPGGEGATSVSSSGSSRKRVNEASHNHHSKKSKSSKGSAGGLRISQHPSETGQETSGEPRP